MPDTKPERPITLGTASPPQDNSPITATEVVAVMLSLLWLGVVVAYFTFTEREEIIGAEGSSGVLIKLFVVFLPIALSWVAAVTWRTVRTLRDEARRLQVAVDAMGGDHGAPGFFREQFGGGMHGVCSTVLLKRYVDCRA